MQLIDPPGGKPWALLGLCGASLVLNLVLAGALVWPSTDDAVADLKAPVDPVVAVANVAGDEAAITPAEAEAVVEAPVVEEPPAPTLPEGVRAASASVTRNLAYTFDKAVGKGSDALAATTARLFVWDLDLRRDLQKGDQVAVAWEMEADLPVVLAATYQSKKLGRTLTAYRFQASGDAYASYWSEDGTEVPHQLVNGPLPGGYQQITSLLKDRPSHAGMDFKVPVGATVVSPKAGRVVRADWNWSNNGNCVEVRWGDGTLARFLHLSETHVKAGQVIAAGDRVGLSGNTGRSTAPHLHYELERSGRTLDPVRVHGTERRRLSAGDAAAFQAEVERLRGLLEIGAAQG